MNRILNFGMSVGLGMILASSLVAQQPLRWDLQKGQSLVIKLTQSTEIVSTVEKRTKNIANSMTLNMIWAVDSVDKKKQISILQTIESVQLDLNDPARGVAGQVQIDTRGSDNDELLKKKNLKSQLLQQVMPLIGLELNIIMSPRGEIVDVVVPPKTLEALRKLPGSMRLRQLLTHQGLKDIWGQSAMMLPENELAVGDEWNSKNEIMLPMGKFARTNTYKLTNSNESQAEIELNTSIELIEPVKIKEGETQVKLVSFNGSGAIQWNAKEGFLSSSKVSNTIKTDRPYREKNVVTSATSTIELSIVPNPETTDQANLP